MFIIDYEHPRGLKRSLVASLLQCDWINRQQNLLLTGPCGSGKTYIACALAQAACMKGYRVKYYRLSRLLLELTPTKADGSYSKALQNLARLDLLILDDWGEWYLLKLFRMTIFSYFLSCNRPCFG